MNVPKLRFKEFNDELSNYKFKDICTFFSGGTPTSSNKDYYNGNIPFIRSGEIYSDNTELFINQDAINNSSAKLVNKGDLLLALYGATSGNVAISKIDGAINQAILCIKPQYGYSKIFIRYLLENKKETILKTFLQGGQGNLSAEIIKNLNYSFPQIEEQEKIGNMLSLLDKKIELQTRKIEDLKLFKKGLHNKLFNEYDGDDYLLSDIAIFENGKGHENIVDDNGEYILINSKFISTEGNVIKKCSEQLTPLFKNDITMVMSDLPNGKALAKCYYIDEDNKYSLNQRICKIKIKDDSVINSKYLFYLLNRNHYFLKFDDGVNQTNLKKDDILSLNLVLPSIKDQERNSKILTIIDNLIEKENNKLSKLNLLKKGLMQNMFV